MIAWVMNNKTKKMEVWDGGTLLAEFGKDEFPDMMVAMCKVLQYAS